MLSLFGDVTHWYISAGLYVQFLLAALGGKDMHLIANRQINSSNWWLMALQAIVAIIVGILIMA